MSSPKNRNAKRVSKTVELSGPVRNKINIENLHSPKKEKGSMQVKNILKPPDVGHNNSLPDDTEKSCLQTPSNSVIKEASHLKELESAISSTGCVESTQYKTSDISYTRKSTREDNQCNAESLKGYTTKNPSKEKKENNGQLNCQVLCEHNNVKESNNEAQTTTEMYETLESLPLNTNTDTSTDNALSRKKERQKMVKKLSKDEKRKQHELEYKKNLHYPKGQRIQVIDHNTFYKILKDDGSLHSENKRAELRSEEFPALNLLKPNRFPVMRYQNFSVQSDIVKSQVQDKVTNNVRESTKISDSHSVVSGGMINKTEKKNSIPNKLGTKGSLKKIGKLPKKRDPIQIDILQCIKVVKSKDAVVEPRKKLSTLERRNDSSLISGNELDSSNPQRSRGKKREQPRKKRPTRLKLIILHERELRKQLETLQESALSQTHKSCFGTETSMNLLTTEGINSEQVETVTNVSENEVVKVEPGSVNLLTAGDIKVEHVESVTNVSDNKVVRTVTGSTNLLTARAIKLELVESVNNMPDSEIVETVPGSTNLQTAGAIKLEKSESAKNVLDNNVIETMPESTNLLTAGAIKLEQVESVNNVSDSEVAETVSGSTNLLTAGAMKLEQVESINNVLDSEVVVTVPGSTNSLTAGAIKLAQVEPVANVSDSEVVKTGPGVEDISKEVRNNCEMSSSKSKIIVATTDQYLNAEDDGQIHLLSSQHVTNNQPYTNDRGKFPDLTPSLLSSVPEILKKENQEFNRSVKRSCCSANLKRGQHSVAATGDNIKPIHISSNAVKHEILNSSQGEHCIDSLETVSFTDQDTCNNVHQMDCRKFARDNVYDSSSDHKETTQKTIIHSRKFRPYCDHFLTPEINNSVSTLLKDIVKFHDRQFERDPVKANARRRHVTGLREVLKYLNLKRLKLIIIAPDMELIQGKGGICDIVEQLKEGAQNQEIPYVFALHRRELGKITIKKVPVSCIGIINYDGTEKNFHSLVTALQVARAHYQEALRNMSLKDTHSEEIDVNKQVIEAALSRLTEKSSTSWSEQSCFCPETIQKWEE